MRDGFELFKKSSNRTVQKRKGGKEGRKGAVGERALGGKGLSPQKRQFTTDLKKKRPELISGSIRVSSVEVKRIRSENLMTEPNGKKEAGESQVEHIVRYGVGVWGGQRSSIKLTGSCFGRVFGHEKG